MIRAKMDRAQRAKQFAPFAALKGFEEALREKERIIVPKVELYEEKKAEIDSILRNKKKQDSITVIYYNNEEDRISKRPCRLPTQGAGKGVAQGYGI